MKQLLKYIFWNILCILNIKGIFDAKNNWMLSLYIFCVIICVLNISKLINQRDANS